MSVCNKCGIDKPADQYYTYWHSTQKKYRTRRICTPCMSKQKYEYKSKIRQENEKLVEVSTPIEITQPDPPESIINDFSNNPDYKYCVGCDTWKLKTEYFVAKNKSRNTITLFKRCKWCHNSNNREKAKLYWEERRKNFGGSEHISSKPGKYIDEYQKEQTFWLMNLLKWEYNEEKNVWTKKGIKELKDDKLFWPKIKPKPKKEEPKRLPHGYRKDIDIQKIISLKNLGWSITAIATELGCSIPTVRDRINNHYHG